MDVVGGSWVGTFACSVCKRKRLTAESFSGTQLRKLREQKVAEDKLKCKTCVADAEAALREIAYEARKANTEVAELPLWCGMCKKLHPPALFSNTQARKSEDLRKCRTCSAAAEADEAAALSAMRAAKLKDAQTAVANAEKVKGAGGVASRLLAAVSESAAEAEHVTGLKPVAGARKFGRGRGRGRGRGSWRGRGK